MMDPKFAEKEPRIRRGRVDCVDLYEIKDSELDYLESGSPGGIFLNFAIFLFSIGFSAIAALATATFTRWEVKTFFILISIVGIIGGVLLLVLWCGAHRSMSKIIEKIRSRIPPEQLAEESAAAEAAPPTVPPEGAE
ncbi:MAG: hypothetical protein HY598_03105 [Candidatus Omnitrophica bacterium]|nr:hypothetical protein [Candidatus Omnitrophota bacterium]